MRGPSIIFGQNSQRPFGVWNALDPASSMALPFAARITASPNASELTRGPKVRSPLLSTSTDPVRSSGSSMVTRNSTTP